MGAGAGQTGFASRRAPQQQMPRMQMPKAMPPGMPQQAGMAGLGALAAQQQQAGQMDPQMMAMMKRLQLGVPGAGQMPQGPQMGQPPAGFDAFMQQRNQQDAMNAQRAMQSGAMPQFQAQMQQRDMQEQGITQADIDRMRNLQMSGDPSFQAESDALNARANANRMAAMQGQFAAQGGMPGMAAPGGGMPPGFPVGGRQMPVMGGSPDKMGGQRPSPMGAGGKGAGMPPRPGMANPRGQAAQSVNPFMAQMMRGRMG